VLESPQALRGVFWPSEAPAPKKRRQASRTPYASRGRRQGVRAAQLPIMLAFDKRSGVESCVLEDTSFPPGNNCEVDRHFEHTNDWSCLLDNGCKFDFADFAVLGSMA